MVGHFYVQPNGYSTTSMIMQNSVWNIIIVLTKQYVGELDFRSNEFGKHFDAQACFFHVESF